MHLAHLPHSTEGVFYFALTLSCPILRGEMWAKYKQQSGFTIVELLIVIVVIGILAAITIVAYNGVQQRSTNQQMSSAIRAYYSAITAYVVDNGALPAGNACLGPADLYISNPCYIGNSTYSHSATLNNSLTPYLKTIPTLPNTKIVGSTFTGSGIFYYVAGNYIAFPIQGTTTCPTIAGATVQATLAVTPDVYCRLNLPQV